MPIFRGKNIVSAVTDYKDSVRCATRTNISLSSVVTAIDGVTLANLDRVLLAGQTLSNQNGIYTWSSASSTLSRAHDADSAFELTPGTRVYVEEGDTYARTNWTLITQGVITPGVTSIVFAKESVIGTSNIGGTYGSSTKTLQIAVDESGQITAVTEYTIDGLPSQTNNSGKYLTTNGTTASWTTVDALPSQTNNSGKYLTTNGTTASWATISTTLSGLSDVDTSGVADTYGLVYDSATTSWKTEQIIQDNTIIDGGGLDGPTGGSGVTVISDAHSIDELSDVVITNPTNNQVLKFNGTNWVNGTDSAGTSINSIDDINDVVLTSPSNGQVLKFNGTNWINAADAGGIALTDISVTDAGGDGSLSYDNTTGVITYTGPSASEIRAHFSAGTGITITNGAIATTITQYADSDARAAISVSGSLSYNSSTGVVSYTTPNTDGISEGSTNLYYTDSRARAAVSAGTGLSYNSGTGSFSVDNTVTTLTGSQTLTNKRITTRIGTNGATTSGTIIPTADTADQYNITGLTGSITIDIPSGTPTDGQKLMIRIEDNGTARAISWTTGSTNSYRVIGSVLPTTTTASKTIYVGCIYNALDSFWDVIAVAQEA